MPSVGTAYVNVRVSTKGFESSLEAMLKRLSSKMEAAGANLGKDFERGLNKTNFDKSFDKMAVSADRASTRAEGSLHKVVNAARDATDSVGDLGTELEGVARSARKVRLGNIGGGGGGGGFRKAASDGNFFSRTLDDIASKAPSAQRALAGLYNTAAFTGTALAGVVGAASAAGQAIFAVGANAAAAAPALSVMANGLLALGQAGAVVGVSMQGVGAALTAGFAAADKAALSAGTASTGASKAVGGLGKATEGAARAVRDAKQGLQDAYRDSARAAEDAARRVADAEHALAEAQRESEIAQRALNDARQEGIEQMEDIAFAAEEAGLAEERAKLDLADAQQALIETSELAPDDRARVEAELAFKEAELNMREAKDRREDADKAQRESVKKGIEGTDAMTQAHQDVADAQQAEADAERDLADARREAARTAEDSARRIADAQQSLADAQKSLADAQKGLGAAQKAGAAGATALATAQDKYALALAKLSPSQREFVERIVGMRDEYEQFARTIGEPLFARILTAMDTLNQKGKDGKTIMDVLTQGLVGTSKALGDTAIKAADLAADDVFQASFGDAMKSNNEAMRNFGDAGVDLADAFIQVADAGGPLFIRFSEWVQSVADGWAETARLNNRTGDLTATFNRAGDRVSEFWDLAKELWRTLVLLGDAANKASNRFDDLNDKDSTKGFIPNTTENLKAFNDALDAPGQKKKLIDDFTQSLRTLNAVGAAFKTAIIDPLTAMGQDPNIEQAFRTISESDAFDRLAATAGDAVPELAEIVVNVADILATLSESGSIDAFLGLLEQVSGAVSDILDFLIDWDTEVGGVGVSGGKLLGIFGAVYGSIRAVKLLWGGFKFLVAGTLGDVRKIGGALKGFKTGGFRGALAGFKSGGAGAAGAAGEAGETAKIVAAITEGSAAVVTAIDACCARLSLAMGEAAAAGTGGELLGAAPRATGGAAGAGMLGAGAIMPAGEAAKVSRFAGVMGKFGKVLGPATKLMKPLSFGIRALGAAFRFALGPVGLIVLTLLPLLWPLLVKLEEKTGIFSKTLEVLTDVFTWLWDNALKPAFDWLADNAGTVWDALTTAIDATSAAFGWLWDKVKSIFGWFKSNWPLLLGIITGPIGLAIVLIIKYWDDILAFLQAIPGKIAGFFSGMWDGIVTALQAAWDWVKDVWANIVDWVKGRPDQFKNNLRALWNIFSDGLRTVWDRVKHIWDNIVTWVKGRPAQFVKNLRLLWDIFRTALSKAWTAVKNIWTRVTTWVKGRPAQFANNLATLWDVFKGKLDDAWTAVQTKWETIKTAIGNWPGQLKNKLADLWDGLGEGLATAWNTVATALENKVIGGINTVLGKFGVDKINVSIPRMAQGGPVRGPGGPRDDRVPTLLSNGEYVLPTKSARKIGPKSLEYMRKHGQMPPWLATGGLGDFLHGVASGFSSVGSALAHGAETAAKWVIGKAIEALDLKDNWVAQSAMGALKQSIDAIVKWVVDKEPVAVPGVAVSASGWTYPLTHRVIITQYPNPGHNPSNSVDLGAPMGTGVRAAAAGIAYQHTAYGYGNYMTVSHAGGVSTLYAHLASFKVASGSKVLAGQIIALSDSTGAHTSGPHLHFELNPSSNTVSAMAARGVRLAQGGVVAPSPAGTLALLAEAGQHERVTPLDSEGFTPAERRILESLESQFTGSGDTYHVHPSQQMDERALADMVARRVAWKRRRGGGTR